MDEFSDLNENILNILDEILESEEVQYLFEEEGKRHPFKRKAHLGPGPKEQHNQKAEKWDCDCTYNKCKCIGKGAEAGRVKYTTGSAPRLNPKKAAYNKLFKSSRKHKDERNAYLKAERQKNSK